MTKRCKHVFKGLFGKYVFRMVKRRDGFLWTDYQCQKKGCNYWRPTFKHRMTKKGARTP